MIDHIDKLNDVLLKMNNISYSKNSGEVYTKFKESGLKDSGYELLFFRDNSNPSIAHKLDSLTSAHKEIKLPNSADLTYQIYINHDKHDLKIVIPGTRVDKQIDVLTDYYLLAKTVENGAINKDYDGVLKMLENIIPAKNLLGDVVNPIGKMAYDSSMKSIKEEIGLIKHLLSDYSNYKLEISGHSLGGLKASVLYKELEDVGMKVDHVYTFDSAASAGVKNELFKNIDSSELKAKITNVNLHNNLVNNFSEQLGDNYTVHKDSGGFLNDMFNTYFHSLIHFGENDQTKNKSFFIKILESPIGSKLESIASKYIPAGVIQEFINIGSQVLKNYDGNKIDFMTALKDAVIDSAINKISDMFFSQKDSVDGIKYDSLASHILNSFIANDVKNNKVVESYENGKEISYLDGERYEFDDAFGSNNKL